MLRKGMRVDRDMLFFVMFAHFCLPITWICTSLLNYQSFHKNRFSIPSRFSTRSCGDCINLVEKVWVSQLVDFLQNISSFLANLNKVGLLGVAHLTLKFRCWRYCEKLFKTKPHHVSPCARIGVLKSEWTRIATVVRTSTMQNFWCEINDYCDSSGGNAF